MKKFTLILVSFSFLIGTIVSAQSVPDSTYYERLYYTSKVWGYLKYFHSEVAKGEYNWDEELIEVLKKIKNDSTEIQFNQTLMNLINKAGNCSYQNIKLPVVSDSLKFNLELDWYHNPIFSDSVKSALDSISVKFRPQENYYIGEAWAGGNPTFENDNQFYQWGFDQFPDEELRLLALFRYWNIINYFFPYKNIVDQNWDSTLVEFIPKIVNANSRNSYHLTFLELSTRLNDSHAATYSVEINSNIIGLSYLPISLKYVENETVVTGVYSQNNEIKVGDIIKSINGNNIYTLRDSLRTYTRGSNDARINHYINERIVRGTYGNVEFSLKNNIGSTNVTLSRNLGSSQYYSLARKNTPIWHEIDKNNYNYGYVDMGRLEVNQIESMFNELWETDAIILDIRSYPNETMWSMVEYFFDSAINIANFTIPDINYPGTLFWHHEYVGQNNSTPNYDKPIFILFNESTQSQAEYTVMAFEQHSKAVKIGSQTSGADGNVSKIYLPGGIYTYFTGLGAFYPDYSRTQRVGIVPDIEVYPTIQGIREGRDELLEAVLNYNITNVNYKKNSEMPNNFALSQNYPNPFNPSTTIKYHLPANVKSEEANRFIPSGVEGDLIQLKVYDILGREVATLVNQKQKPGYYEVTWDTNKQPSGIYFYQLTAGNFVKTRKMVLLK